MNLAKQFVDVGLFTNRIEEMRAFYTDQVRLPYEELLAIGPGLKQHRYGLLGSVLKINHVQEALPPRQPAGYQRIAISDPRTPMPLQMQDPDGNVIDLIPVGQRGVKQIEIQIGVTDQGAFDHFYRDALQCERIGDGRFRLGETIIAVAKDAQATRAAEAPAASAMDVIGAMRAVGFRYITVQVRDCDAEFRRMQAMGVWIGARPITLGEVARICFVRDPDGNFIEISQRASLTGPLPKD